MAYLLSSTCPSLPYGWDFKEVLPVQDPGVLTTNQSFKVSLIHRSSIGRHPVKKYACTHAYTHAHTRTHTHKLVSLDQSQVSPETSWKLDFTSIYLQRTQNLSEKDDQIPDLPFSMALFLPQFLCPRSQEFRSPTSNLFSGERNLAGHLIPAQE